MIVVLNTINGANPRHTPPLELARNRESFLHKSKVKADSRCRRRWLRAA